MSALAIHRSSILDRRHRQVKVHAGIRKSKLDLAIIGAAANDAEKAWLQEFGARFICDALDEQSEQLARAVRANL